MRGYLTFHRKPEAVKYYFPKSARILTGTIFVRNEGRAYDHFEKYSRYDEDNFFHITLSLPRGITLSRQRWRDEIDEHLRSRGTNPAQVPWLAWLDTSTAAEHIHLYGLLRTFDGRPVQLDTSRRTTDRAQRDFARRLGVGDPAPSAWRAPRLKGGIQPKKALPVDLAQDAAASLNHAMRHWLPSTIPELNMALYEGGGPWRVSLESVEGQGRSIRCHRENEGKDFALSRLGPDFYPSEMFRRLDFAGRVKTGRAILQLKQTLDHPEIQSRVNELKEKLDARSPQPEPRNHSEQPAATHGDDGRDRGEGRGPTSAPRVASKPGSDPFQLREAHHRTVDPLRRTNGFDGTDYLGHEGGPTGAIQSSANSPEPARGARPRVTLFEWLRSIVRQAARVGRFWYALRNNRTIVDVVFEDKSVAAVTSAQAWTEDESDTNTMARRFVKIYEPRSLYFFDRQTTSLQSDVYDAEEPIRFDAVSESSEAESELDPPNDDGPSF